MSSERCLSVVRPVPECGLMSLAGVFYAGMAYCFTNGVDTGLWRLK